MHLDTMVPVDGRRPPEATLVDLADLLTKILAELQHSNSADRTGAVSSITFEDLAKGDPKVTTKSYIGSPLTRSDVDDVLDIHAYAHREAARHALDGWKEAVDELKAVVSE